MNDGDGDGEGYSNSDCDSGGDGETVICIDWYFKLCACTIKQIIHKIYNEMTDKQKNWNHLLSI